MALYILLKGTLKNPEKLNELIGESDKIILKNEELINPLYCKNVSFLKDYLTEEINEKIFYETLKWQNDWSDKKIFANKNFKELFSVDGISLWWFVNSYDFFLKLQNIMQKIALFDSILKKEKPEIVTLITENIDEIFIMENLCTDKNVEFQSFTEKRHIKNNTVRHFSYRFYPPFYRFLFTATKLLKQRIVPKKIGSDKASKIVFISNTLNWRDIIDFDSGKKIGYDIMLGEIWKKMLIIHEYQLIHTDFVSSKGLSLRKTKEKARELKEIMYKPFELYIDNKVHKRVKKPCSNIIKRWKFLRKDRGFQDSFYYNGVNLFVLLKDTFNEIFFKWFPASLYYLEGMKALIEKENPDLLVLSSEAGFYGRAFVAAAKTQGVKTLGVQHGAISPVDIMYAHPPDEICNDLSPHCCPIPDLTAVYGDYTKEVLIEYGHYPAERIAVCGQPRYDVLHNPDEIFDKNTVYEKLGIKKEKGIVVLATQTHGPFTKEENVSLLEGVYTAMEDFEDIQLVVKLHPHESPQLHKEGAEKLGISDTIIIKDIDILELVYASKLLITVYSTTSLEAMILDKPVITINLTGRPDPFPFAASGAALGVYKREDIKKAISDALYNEETRNKLAKNRKKFIHEQCYIIDGRASERVANLIEKMIKSSRRETNEK